MNISADSDLFIVISVDVNESLLFLEELDGSVNDHECVLLVQCFLVFLPLHQTLDPL